MGGMQVKPSTLPVIAVASAVVLSSLASIRSGKLPGARILIGGMLAAVMLSAAAGPFPGVVRALSVVMILAVVLGPGYSLVRPLTSLIAKP